MLRVLLADAQTLDRQCLRALLRGRAGTLVVGEASRRSETLRLAVALEPDILLLDAELTGWVELMGELDQAGATCRVILLSGSKSVRLAQRGWAAGVYGFVNKSHGADELDEALRVVGNGGRYLCGCMAQVIPDGETEPTPDRGYESLSSREREVLQRLAQGWAAREIATKLEISVKTVEAHRRNIMEKMGLSTVPQLVRLAVREGLVEGEEEVARGRAAVN